MSGGSFEYLCFKYGPDLASGDALEAMEAMAELLEEEGSTKAAADTKAIVDRLKNVEVSEELRRVWHHVEWWKSCDYSRDQAMDAVREYDMDGESE